MICVHCKLDEAAYRFDLCATCYFKPDVHRAYRTGSKQPPGNVITLRAIASDLTDEELEDVHRFKSKLMNPMTFPTIVKDITVDDVIKTAETLTEPERNESFSIASWVHSKTAKDESQRLERQSYICGLDLVDGESKSTWIMYDQTTGKVVDSPPSPHPLSIVPGIGADDYTRCFMPTFHYDDVELSVISDVLSADEIRALAKEHGKSFFVYYCKLYGESYLIRYVTTTSR